MADFVSDDRTERNRQILEAPPASPRCGRRRSSARPLAMWAWPEHVVSDPPCRGLPFYHYWRDSSRTVRCSSSSWCVLALPCPAFTYRANADLAFGRHDPGHGLGEDVARHPRIVPDDAVARTVASLLAAGDLPGFSQSRAPPRHQHGKNSHQNHGRLSSCIRHHPSSWVGRREKRSERATGRKIPFGPRFLMGIPSTAQVTNLLLAWGNGDEAAFERLVPLVHAELAVSRDVRWATSAWDIPSSPPLSSTRPTSS